SKNRAYLNYRTELEALAANDELDRHALTAPTEAEKSLESLAAYLVKPAKTDRDKSRLVYCWMTDRINYDQDGFRSGKVPDQRPQAVLQSRKAVCQGYADLFSALCKEAGVEAVTVIGYTHETGPTPGKDPPRPDHGWNAVKLDGRWRLLDATWGSCTS